MGVLILLSALFSGSEAALFSLKPRGRRRLVRSGIGGRMAVALLDDPERLLSAILFWNLLINMIYFAIASIVGTRIESNAEAGSAGLVVFTGVSLLTIIFFSEMLPKCIAVLAPVRFSVLVGPPLSLAVWLVHPILPWVQLANRFASRLIWPQFQAEPEIELTDIERAIELGTDDAALLNRERLAMRGIVSMAETRVSEVMRPRSRLRLATVASAREVLIEGTPPGGYLMITDANAENIVSAIGVRLLRPSQMDDLPSATEPVIYVPWSSTVSQVWDRLDDRDCSVAVIVNEFGGAIGALSADDILRRVLAPRDAFDEASEALIQELDGGRLRVNGATSLRVLAKRLSVDLPDETVATVAGFIQRTTERRPREGDVAMMEGFELRVAEQDEQVTWIEVQRQADSASGEVAT